MISTELFIISLAVSAVINILMLLVAFAALSRAARSAQWAAQCADWIDKNNKKSRVLREMGELQAELTNLTDLYASLNSTMKKLRSRIGMRELNARRQGEDVPTDAEGVKRELRKTLHLQKFGGPDGRKS